MKSLIVVVGIVIFCAPLLAQEKVGEPQKYDKWTKELKDRSQRGTMHNAFQKVRGDSGKWNEEPKLQHAPPLSRKPARLTLDDWYDRLERKRHRPLTPSGDNWLMFKTRQLDDNDRVWIERIERDGSHFTVVLNQAIWQGRYQKTFTCYNVFGVNLGKLPTGKYEATLVVKRLVFKQFEGNGRPRDEKRRDNWPKDESPVELKPVELTVGFSVVSD